MNESGELGMLRDSARRLMDQARPPRWSSAGRTGRSDPALWARMAGDGWLYAGLDPEQGGYGFGAAEAGVLAEEAGRGLLAEPYIANLAALRVVAALAAPEVAGQVIDAVTAGRQKLALVAGPAKRSGTREPAGRLSGKGALDGKAGPVPGGADADLLAVVAQDAAGEACVLLVPAQAKGVKIQGYALVDGAGAADIVFDSVALSDEAVLTSGAKAAAAAAEALDYATALVCATGVGAMNAAFELTLEYVKQRVQFGETIGRNQALQHRLVDVMRKIRECEILTDAALAAIGGEASERARAVSAAKAHVSAAMRHVGQEAVQMHGAIGTTDEAQISHYFKTLVTLGPLFGDGDWHRARFAALKDDGDAGAGAIHLSPEDQAFVEEVAAFVDETLDPDTRAKVAAGGHPDRAQTKAWELALGNKGWRVYTWTKEQGGPGFSPLQQFLFEETLARCHAPGDNGLESRMAGPVIREFGTPEQRAQHLPGIISGEVSWCQGYSEPGAGSDLASLSTRAELDGEDYVVNGQKIWTSMAHWADWMFMLVRTSKESTRQAGITFLLVDMKSPGITVRPIRASDGHHGFNEVFFENVRVPVANRIGEEGRGWTYAKFLLKHERLGVVSLPGIKHGLARAEAIVEASGADDVAAARLAGLKIRLRALEGWVQSGLRQLLEGGSPGDDVSLIKIAGTELNQDIAEFAMDMLGEQALPYVFDAQGASPARLMSNLPPDGEMAVAGYLYRRAFTILGGSTEIQKNIVSKRVLGL